MTRVSEESRRPVIRVDWGMIPGRLRTSASVSTHWWHCLASQRAWRRFLNGRSDDEPSRERSPALSSGRTMRHFAIFPRSSRNSPYANVEKAGDATSRVDRAASELRRASTTRSSPLFLMSFMLRSAQFHRAMLGLQSGRRASSFSTPRAPRWIGPFQASHRFRGIHYVPRNGLCRSVRESSAPIYLGGNGKMPGSEMAQSPVDVAERFGQALKIGKDQGSEVAVDVLGTPLKEQVGIPGPLFIPDQGAWPFLFNSANSSRAPGNLRLISSRASRRRRSRKSLALASWCARTGV